MNRIIAQIVAGIVSITVALFAFFLFISDFASFLVCIFLALGYLLPIGVLAALHFKKGSPEERAEGQMRKEKTDEKAISGVRDTPENNEKQVNI